MIKFKDTKIILTNAEPGLNAGSDDLANIIMARIGLLPRKKGSTDKMHQVLLELYERAKQSYRKKRPEMAIMTVEDMGSFAGISRQTMYDYLSRWTELGLIAKTSFINEGKVIIGYKLNGNTLEQAFDRSISTIQENLSQTQNLIRELQRTVKNEKISESQKINQIDKRELEYDEPEVMESEQKSIVTA